MFINGLGHWSWEVGIKRRHVGDEAVERARVADEGKMVFCPEGSDQPTSLTTYLWLCWEVEAGLVWKEMLYPSIVVHAECTPNSSS